MASLASMRDFPSICPDTSTRLLQHGMAALNVENPRCKEATVDGQILTCNVCCAV